MILPTWNDTTAPLPEATCVHELVEAQVERTPSAVAAEFGAERLSYRDLNARANRIAHHLRGLGVGHDVLVGICMSRSLDAVAAILGVLKAGGAYVPLDATYPRERLAFMLEDAAIRVLVTERALLPLLPEVTAHLVCLDDEGLLSAEPSENPELLTTAESLAYVLYTSGSTGRSKGVAMPRLPLVNLVAWQLKSYSVPGPARTLHFASMSFDVSFQEIFSTWSSGGTLIIVPEETRRDPPALARLLVDREVERAYLPPVVLQHLAEVFEGKSALPRRLSEIITAGEALRVTPPIATFLARLRDCTLQNHYGPTETHVATAFTVPSPVEVGTPSIGRPISNAQIHLLDDRLSPVPIGVPGELYIGGKGLARGYLGRPELTAERFLPDPFCPGGRLYRTGDRCQWEQDGTVTFLGRLDHQVKIRGYRIELGEIEAALAEHPSVKQAVVTAREDVPGDKRLAAYLVSSDPGSEPATERLRRHLKTKLPDYMVPAAFTWLDAIPLLPNGKTDRLSLPAPPAAGDRAFTGPRTPAEGVLAGIWADVLRLDRVGVDDDFFALGGHSLRVTQVLTRVGSAFGVELPLRALFEAPTVASLAARVEAARESGNHQAAPPLVPRSRRGEAPLSPAQQQMWLLDQLDPDSATYTIPMTVRLDGPLDPRALERSLEEIVRRHEALRTTFRTVNGEPRQVIAAPAPIGLPLVDLESLPEAERDAEAQRLAALEAQKPFNLARGPLFRAALMRLSARAHVLSLTMHHIVSDGWSLGILLAELSALYEAFSAGRPSPLAELTLQVADVALWQREWLSDEALGEELRYWREQLRGAPAALSLPTDRPRPAGLSYRGDTHRFMLSRGLAAALGELCRREGVTLFMALLAAFQTLLHRYSGEDDIVVGSPIAGRTRVETEDLIGFFVNTLVLRADLGGEPTFRELLGRVREMTLGAYAHQDLPFARLVEELSPARELGRSPLFQVMLVLENAPSSALSMGELSPSWFEVERGTAKVDLTLSIQETEEGLAAALEYATDLFDAGTIARMAGHLRSILEACTRDPAVSIDVISLLDEAERRTLLRAWNDTTAPIPEGVSLHQLFEQQVDRTPERTALIDGRERLSYQRIEAWSNAVAHRLQALGVGPGVLVGVSVHRSTALVAAVLGILKAGGAYVPLDPTYPRARLAQMIALSELRVIVTDELARQALPVHTADLVPAGEPLAGERVTRPERSASARDLAYVLFTSGSTGVPKGVEIEHRSAVALLAWAGGVFSADELARVLFSTSISFDLSVFELFLPLSAGGAIVVAQNALELPSLPASREVTLINTVPSAMAELLRAKAVPASARTVCLAGEPLSQSLASAVHAEPTIEKLYNLYGPTEATTYATFLLARRDGSAPTLGRPIENTQLYILDPLLSPLPIGVTGEIYLGGAGLARGYLHQPELTRERFVASPFVPGERLYRTGDLGRFRADGEIEYLGRIDHQVKIRGYRIELGEIESVLRKIPGVREAIVVAREDPPGEKRLVAYVQLEGDPVSTSALREQLAAALPQHMIPSTFVALGAFPLTPNGKVDRRALQTQSIAISENQRAFVGPRTPQEELLARIWAEVLHLDRVSVHDDFFALGGHSLLGTRVIARLGAAFGVDLPLRALFEARTVALLASRIEAAQESEQRPAPPILPSPRTGPLPLSFAQQRLWLLDRLDPGSAAYTIPVALRLEGPLDQGALERSLAEIVRRHEPLRTTFATVDGEPRQVIAPPSLSLSSIDLRSSPELELSAQRLVTIDAQRPFELSSGPLFRASLLQIGDRAHLLLMNMHHVISDGWSLGVLAKELASLYEAFSAGRLSPLPELPIRYSDYAIWQREWLSGDVLSRQLAYWKDQLRGLPDTLELPSIRPRPRLRAHRGGAHRRTLSPELTAALAALCRREGVTLFMALLAAFQALLARYSGQDDIAVGSPIAGRTRAETEGLIGLFLNTLVLRARLSPELGFRALCAQVREVTLGAFAHQDLPFERLVDELSPPRDLGRSPLFQVYFNLLNLATPIPSLAGLGVALLDDAEITALFDLNLYAAEQEDGIALTLVYGADLFDAPQTAAMLDHLIDLLHEVTSAPDRPIARIPLAPAVSSPAEAARIKGLPRIDFRRFGAEEIEQPIHRRFSAEARRAPEKTAIQVGAQALSYGELDARAGAVAAAIVQALGREPAQVGLLFDHGAPMVAAMLGASMAGKVYVPLDPTLPEGRLSFMIEDAGISAVLTDGPLRARALSLAPPGCPVIDLSSLPSAEAPEVQVSPSAPAYILYTSGSTGRPKGVVQSHRNVLHHVRNYINRLHLDPNDTLSLLSSYAFDAAVMDIFGALLSGATLCPIDLKGGALEHLPSLLRQRAITVYHSTPTVFRHLTGMLGPGEQLPQVRLVVLGGEEAQARDVSAYRAHFAPTCLLVNGMGPTESTLALQYFVDHGTAIARETVPVGYPVEGVEIRLLTPMGEQVAPYGIGQIELRSPHVALGYWKRPELTQAAFAPDPEGGDRRIYRTGDIGRLLPDGAIEYLGRADHQVKVRGHRIELGEIEAGLLACPGVARAVVAVREDVPGDRTLAAYLVAAEGASLSPAQVRSQLQKALPAYMIPSAFLLLDALPLLPNGKVDRRALPAPERARATEGAHARDDIEARLAAIFRNVLGLASVGVDQSFFDLGGHSMLAVRLVEQINRQLGATFPLVSLFEAQSVAQIAARLREGGTARRDHALVPIRTTGGERPLFLVSRPNVNSLGYIALARFLDPDRPVYGLQCDYPEDAELGRPYSRDEYLAWATSYVATIRLLQPEGPYLLGGMCEGALIAFTMTRLLEEQGQRVALLSIFDSWPEENTRRRWIYELFNLRRRARVLLSKDPRSALDLVWQKLGAALGELRRPGSSGEPEERSPWDERIFPGPSFVPPRVAAPIAVFKVKKQPYWRVHDERLGWGDRSAGAVAVHPVPGDHRTILREPQVAELGRLLEAEIRAGG